MALDGGSYQKIVVDSLLEEISAEDEVAYDTRGGTYQS